MTTILNIRDPKTGASVLPQYNLLNLGYAAYVQTFERIKNREYPDYIDDYMEKNGITPERVWSQMQLIADLLDGLFSKEYSRDESMSYLRKAMQDCDWGKRFDWEAMAVFDMLSSQAWLASYFLAIADHVNESEIRAQNAGELREIVKNLCKRAGDELHAV